MKTLLLAMTGVGFTLGVVFGLLMQLPIDYTLPADYTDGKNKRLSNTSVFRSRRSLSEEKLQHDHNLLAEESSNISSDSSSNSLSTKQKYISLDNPEIDAAKPNLVVRHSQENLKLIEIPAFKELHRRANTDEENINSKYNYIRKGSLQEKLLIEKDSKQADVLSSDKIRSRLSNNSNESMIVSVKFNLQKHRFLNQEKPEISTLKNVPSKEDSLYISSIVKGITWTPQTEQSCPRPFQTLEAEAWRARVEGLDVVKMEEGCGRMQNRLVTFRDASKACVRYRMNTDQIQGEIYSYYLSRLLNMSNIPPTMLARVDAISPKWRTVHLKMSLAQWADSKIVVLTQHIDELSPAHIPNVFREVGRLLEPTVKVLGSISHSELCELFQWSDLIIFDYLTANLDRVINNMFNRQWNDQMMSSPAHNLEQRPDGGLLFLDNESGLFHGYRLLDKYSSFHRSLLHALCVFRDSTIQAIKRLHKFSNIGKELHALFARSEHLHKHLPAITDKNVKILQQRLDDVYHQILRCERLFNR